MKLFYTKCLCIETEQMSTVECDPTTGLKVCQEFELESCLHLNHNTIRLYYLYNVDLRSIISLLHVDLELG